MSQKSTLFIQRTHVLRTINTVGKSLHAVGLDPFKLSASGIRLKAAHRAGFNPELPRQAIEGLARLCQSINTEARPNPFGKLAARNLFERTLYGRLMVEQVLAADPEIAQSDISEPVFIIGMPRTGTTILHALLYEDHSHRAPLAWECLLPYPVPRPHNFTDNEQVRTIKKEFGQLFKLVPDFQKKHHMAADSPQECLGINALDFNTFQPSAQFYIPSYMEWFSNEADKLLTMQWHRSFLQYLQSGGVRADRWLLKSPVHMMRLPELFAVYPDARIIMTHREPKKIVPSTASLMSSVRSLYSDNEDPRRTAHEQSETWSTYFSRFLDSRNQLNKEDQIMDIRFEDFVSDQMQVVQKIYDRFGWELGANARVSMQQFLANNPRDKYGLHSYTLEDFGLEEAGVNRQFSSYLDFLDTLNT